MKVDFRNSISVLFSLFVLLTVTSCKKDAASSTSGSFKWVYKGVNYTARESLTQHYSIDGISYYWIQGAASNIIRPDVIISVPLLSTRQYNISDTMVAVSFRDDDAGMIYGAASGVINITSASNNSVSGNFSIILGPTGDSVTGTFSNTPVRQ
jgi:hypothetical protein